MLSYFLIRFLFNFFSTHFYTNWRVKGKNRNIFLFQIFSSFSLSIFFSSKKKISLSKYFVLFHLRFCLTKRKKYFSIFSLSFSSPLQKNNFLLQIFSSLSFSVFFSSAKKISLFQTFSPFSSRSFLRDPIFPYLLFFCHSGS